MQTLLPPELPVLEGLCFADHALHALITAAKPCTVCYFSSGFDLRGFLLMLPLHAEAPILPLLTPQSPA